MDSRQIIDLFEEKISGEEVVDYLLGLGTADGFYDHTLQSVGKRKFQLTKVDINELRKTDPQFDAWLGKQNLPEFGFDEYAPKRLRATENSECMEPQHRPDAPVVVVDGKLRDGWHRCAGKFAKGERYINAYVA